MSMLLIIVFVFLALASVIDIIKRSIPSVLLTSLVFVVLALNISLGMTINFGILAFVFAYLLYEIKFIGGVADIKILVVLGLLTNSILSFSALALLTVVIGFLYKLFFKYILKKKEGIEIPFIPCLLIVYSVMWITGLI